jgi:predicted nuclease with RNAse H fold
MPASKTVVGIDLAGSPKRDTGICRMRGKRILEYATVHTDEEIMAFVKDSKPALVVIDAPLHLPPGRKTLEDRNGEHYRPVDRELMRRGIRFFPITLGPMRMLTERGIRLKRRFARAGFTAIEMYPGGAQDVWKIKRKQHGLGALRRGLERLGIRGLERTMNGDELDAVSGGYVGVLYLSGKAEMLGDLKTGAILLPKPSTKGQA